MTAGYFLEGVYRDHAYISGSKNSALASSFAPPRAILMTVESLRQVRNKLFKNPEKINVSKKKKGN